MWWPTCNYNTCTRGRRASFLILLKMGSWRPKNVEWLCRNKTCTVLHPVGVSFDLYIHTPLQDCYCCASLVGRLPRNKKESDPDLNQVSLRVAWYSLALGLTRQKYSRFHGIVRIILRNVMSCDLVGMYHRFGCIWLFYCYTVATGYSHRRPSIDCTVISFTSKPSQVSRLSPCLAVNRSASLNTSLVLSPPPNYFYLI